MASGDGGAAGADGPRPSVGALWLLEAKVLAPALPPGYVRRASLRQHFNGVLERRLTALQAPAGFGKTTTLADVVRERREDGVVVGWMSLDADDTPNLFGSYLAYAFGQAGLDLGLLRAHDAWSSSAAVQQMGMLARAIQQHEAPCLLVLDEVDRLPRRTVQLLDLLLKRAPRNLHLALAFRTSPELELTTHVLDGGSLVVGAEALRFSTADIARFFDGSLSEAELATVEERTAGWPVALRVYRDTRAPDAAVLSTNAARLTENYLGMRLLRDLSQEDRDRLLELAVFDWIEADLVDEVLGSSDTRLRVVSLSALHGLLPASDTDATVRRLHPVLRDHSLAVLSVEDPACKRDLHQRIARALARRGRLTPAWRHAGASGDNRLLAELIERYGPCRLWLRDGVAGLISAGHFLTPEITAQYPRLDLLRCIILCLSSKWDEARTRFEAVSRRTEGFTRDRDGGDADALALDRVFTHAALAGGADGSPLGDLESRLPEAGPGAVGDERGRTRAAARHTLLCVACYERARFEASRRHGLQAAAHASDDTRFGDVFVNTCLGMAAMAQGRVQEAGARYRRARQVARRFFPSDPCLTVSTDVLTIELDLEQNRERTIQQRTLKNLTALRGVWVDVYSTAMAVGAELTFARYDSRAALKLLSKAVDDARETGIESLSNHMSALLAYYLLEAGRSDDAGQVWRDHGLPCGAVELLDLDRQSWRTMEALSCARVRLLAAQNEHGAAQDLAGSLCAVASERGLTRTLLRGLAVSMVAAHRAEQPGRALERLTDFLRAARGVNYSRPLVRHRQVSRTVLRRLLATDPDEDVRTVAESMQAKLSAPAAGATAFFSAREIEILAEAARGLRNKEIAVQLGISDEGVRYHLKNVYRKVGVAKRTEAVKYAQSIGVLS